MTDMKYGDTLLGLKVPRGYKVQYTLLYFLFRFASISFLTSGPSCSKVSLSLTSR